MLLSLFIFFFQAEDGIRDLTVTGVPTCALPIYGPRPLIDAGPGRVTSQPAGAARWQLPRCLYRRPADTSALPAPGSHGGRRTGFPGRAGPDRRRRLPLPATAAGPRPRPPAPPAPRRTSTRAGDVP